jgi:hypothetical protein
MKMRNTIKKELPIAYEFMQKKTSNGFEHLKNRFSREISVAVTFTMHAVIFRLVNEH